MFTFAEGWPGPMRTKPVAPLVSRKLQCGVHAADQVGWSCARFRVHASPSLHGTAEPAKGFADFVPTSVAPEIVLEILVRISSSTRPLIRGGQ
jgi:hypothetical protein